jgi:hypothetical protein
MTSASRLRSVTGISQSLQLQSMKKSRSSIPYEEAGEAEEEAGEEGEVVWRIDNTELEELIDRTLEQNAAPHNGGKRNGNKKRTIKLLKYKKRT